VYWLTKRYLSGILLVLLVAISCNDQEEPLPFTPGEQSKTILQDSFAGEDFVVYANRDLRTMQAFSNIASDGTQLEFEAIPGSFPNILRDQEGNEWDIFGFATKGARLGEQLTVLNSMMGFWFSFAAMYPEVTLFGEEEKSIIPFEGDNSEWTISTETISFATFKDGIQSLDQPQVESFRTDFKNTNYIDEEELVIVYFDGTHYRAFPHKVLDWHEVVNDQASSGGTVVAYCPLTGTASVWESAVQGQNLSFGVSGLLYNSNLILYDRQTESNWVQILQQSVNGPYITVAPKRIPSLEITWSGARNLAENLQVLSEDTGFNRDYNLYPYGEYRTNDVISYPVNYEDTRVPGKERVLAVIIDGKAKVFRFGDFE
jgi:hypothetical protein